MNSNLSQNRSKVIEASLPFVAEDGWTFQALIKGGETVGFSPAQIRILFEGREKEAVTHYSHILDQKMCAKMKTHPEFATLKVHQKVRYGVIARLELMHPHKDVSLKTASFLKTPAYLSLGPKLIFQTCSEIWYTAGDTATDFNYYSKRLILGGVYSATLAYWLRNTSPDLEKTIEFLDNRLKDSSKIPKLKQEVSNLAHLAQRGFRSFFKGH